MPIESPFRLSGPTIALQATAIANAGVQIRSDDNVPNQQYLITNDGPLTVFVSLGSTAGEAFRKCAVPTGALPQKVYPVQSGNCAYITGPANAFFSAVSTVTSTIWVSPGYG